MQHRIVEGCPGERTFSGPARFNIRWQSKNRAVHCQLSIRGEHSRRLELREAHKRCYFDLGRGRNRVAGYLVLTEEYGETTLGGSFRLGSDSFFNGAFAAWKNQQKRPTHEHSEKRNGRPESEVIIENSERAHELFRFMWLASQTGGAPGEPGDHFIFLADPEALPLFRELASSREEPDAAARMRAAASTFFGTPDAVLDLAEFGPPVSDFPRLNVALSRLEGEVPLPHLLELVEDILGEPLGSYLESEAFTTAFARVWMTLFAYALVPDEADCVGDALVGVIRTFRILVRLADLDRGLTSKEGRWEALGAVPVLPDGVVPPPREHGNAARGFVRALGIGEVIIVKQALLGYSRGEIAHTVNILAGERIRLTDRQHSGVGEAWTETTETKQSSGDLTETQGRSESAESEIDLAATASLSRDYTGLEVQSTGLCGIIDGTFAGEHDIEEHRHNRSRVFAEQITTRSANRIVSQVQRSRRAFRYERYTRIYERDIDRREQKDNEVGIYYWLQKHFRLHTENNRRSLILELLLPDPARELSKKVARRTALKAKPPISLEEAGIEGPDSITSSNYLTLAESYGVSGLQDPPQQQIVVTARFTNQPPNRSGFIEIPPGFQAREATVTYLISDAKSELVGYVGDAAFERAPGQGGGDPVSGTGPEIQDASLASEDPEPIPAAGKEVLPLGDTTAERLEIAFFANTSDYAVSVQVQAVLPETLFADRFQAWQVVVFDAILAAYTNRLQAYRQTRDRVLADLTAGRERHILRDALKEGVLRLLGSSCEAGAEAASSGQLLTPPTQTPCPTAADPNLPACPPQTLRFLEGALELTDMTYAFFPWPPGRKPSCPTSHWRGMRTCHETFQSFLEAGSARVLLPVLPGYERAVLFFLGYEQLWNPPVGDTPAIEADVALLAQLRRPVTAPHKDGWQVTIPTTLLVLAEDVPGYSASGHGRPSPYGETH